MPTCFPNLRLKQINFSHTVPPLHLGILIKEKLWGKIFHNIKRSNGQLRNMPPKNWHAILWKPCFLYKYICVCVWVCGNKPMRPYYKVSHLLYFLSKKTSALSLGQHSTHTNKKIAVTLTYHTIVVNVFFQLAFASWNTWICNFQWNLNLSGPLID